MALSFDVLTAESGGFAYTRDMYEGPMETFHRVVQEHEDGRLGEKPFIAALHGLLQATPDFLEVHGQLARYWHDQGKPKKALDAALAGLRIANNLIPEGFNGKIEWLHLENRPYLRTMQTALLSYIRLRRHKDAAALAAQMLSRNPNDNQGVRFLLGSEALRADDLDLALSVLEEYAIDYPPYWYELSLCHIQRGDWVKASTALRRGFVTNPYIAEIICGNPAPNRLSVEHDSDLELPEAARDYMMSYGAMWRDLLNVLYVQWLFNQPKVLVERAAMLECQEALLFERAEKKREQLAIQWGRLFTGIDDGISAAIVTRRPHLGEAKLAWPWLVGVPSSYWRHP